MSAHRVLRDLFRAYEGVGPGIGNDPGSGGTINPTMWGQQFLITTAGAESRTLARPTKAGVLTSVVLDTDGGNLTLTVTGGYNADGDTSITFADAGDMVVFLSVKTGTTYQWTAIAQEGTDVAVESGSFDSLLVSGLINVRTAVGSWPSGGGQVLAMGATGGLGIFAGSGAPTASAEQGSLCMVVDGTSPASLLYVNTNGSTGWTALEGRPSTQAIVAPGAVTVDGTVNRVTVTSAVNGAITLAAPSAAMKGRLLTIEYIGAGTNATTLALTNVQGGTAATTATFNAASETLVLVGGELLWNVVAEIGVTLS